MFTGLIEERGEIARVKRDATGLQLDIRCSKILEGLEVNDSVGVSGICLTVTFLSTDWFRVQAVPETIRRTTIATWRRDTPINLERACTPTTRLGGHLVQGHVDGVGTLKSLKRIGSGVEWHLKIPENLVRYCVEKGSIALEGVSLTVAGINRDMLTVALIPHTLQVTNLSSKKVGDLLNVEVDILAKYVEKLISVGRTPINYERLKKWGYHHEG